MATQARPSLTVDERAERGSRAIRRLRRSGAVPGIVYGGGKDPIAFKVDARALRHVLHEGSALFDLEIDGGKKPVIVKDQQRHPVRGELMHIDLLEVRLDEKIQSAVGVELEGGEEAPGVKEGGVLEHVTRELQILALPTDIPERIVADVSHMEVAGTLHLSEVAAPAGVEFLDDLEETIVATITTPTEVAEPEVEEEAELVGEEGEEAEAPTEGGAEEGGEESGGGES